MTIEQLLKTDVVEEVDEAIVILIKRLNELNEEPNVKYNICKITNKGRQDNFIYLED
jgi:hypothetical protein